jgi:hypothetical protein
LIDALRSCPKTGIASRRKSIRGRMACLIGLGWSIEKRRPSAAP